MSAPACLVTGSSGLVGSEVCAYLSARGAVVHGIDNNERAVFFGPPGDTAWNRERLQRTLPRYCHHSVDIRQSTHSLFGASKLAADVLVEEYGRYFGMPTYCLHAGRITGPNHSGVELHGFLSYLVKCNVEEREYRVFGDKGKQVRDNIHARDVAAFIHAFWQQPRVGEVYNIGGGKANSCSEHEAFEIVQSITGRTQKWICDETARRGDHIRYFSDLRKAKSHYREWNVSTSLRDTVREIVSTWNERHRVR
jgi:CDP-paratose 2-epimerase